MPGHPFSVARHGVYACTIDSMRKIRKVRRESSVRCEVLHARRALDATEIGANLLLRGRERRAVTQTTRASEWRVTFIAYQKLYAGVVREVRGARGLGEI